MELPKAALSSTAKFFISCIGLYIGRQAVLISLQARGNPRIVRARELWRSAAIERPLIVRVISPIAG